MAAAATLPDVDEPTRELLRRATQELHEENPYIDMVTDGNLYLPPEAVTKYGPAGDGEAETEAPESDDELRQGRADQDVMGALPTADIPGLEELKKPSVADLEKVVEEDRAADWKFGVPWHATIRADDFRHPKHTTPSGDLKSRRGVPHIKASELLDGLEKQHGRYFYRKPLNGWPGLQGLMLVSITRAQGAWAGVSKQIVRLWSAKDGTDGKPLPSAAELGKNCRATFWAPMWSNVGWAPTSPGFVYWFSEQHAKPRFLYGSKMLEVLRQDSNRDATITKLHYYAHRYAIEKETWQDKGSYHTLVLAEWSHGQYLTVIEGAWLNAIGGYGGKSNWVEDKLEPQTVLFRTMSEQCPGGIVPWNNTMSELRCADMPMKTTEEFEAYLTRFSEKGGLPWAEKRFVDWQRYQSDECLVRDCTADVLAGFLLNYIQRVWGYSAQHNCQTFATDLYAFLTGTRDLKAYSPGINLVYKQHTMSFLYKPRPSEGSKLT